MREYFRRPPEWIRNLVTVVAVLLALYGSLTASVMTLGEEAQVKFDRVGQTIGDAPAAPATSSTTAVPGSFHAADSAFRALFPATPERTTENFTASGVALTMTMYTAEDAEAVFVVGTVKVPGDFGQRDLEDVANGAAKAIDGSVARNSETTFQGYAARDVTITIADGTIREMVVRAPDRVMQIIVGGGGDVEAKFRSFLSTVQIL